MTKSKARATEAAAAEDISDKTAATPAAVEPTKPKAAKGAKMPKASAEAKVRPDAEVKSKAGKSAGKKAGKKASAATPEAPQTAPGENRLPSYQELLDETLVETFPASDPISSSSVVYVDEGHATERDAQDWDAELPGSDELPSRDDKVRHAAYLRAQARGFEPGHDVEDWLAAEAEIDRRH